MADRRVTALGALLSALAVAGCGGSGSTATGAASPTGTASPTTAPALPERGGLVGVIDQARLVGMCENVRLAVTAADGGLGAASVAASLDAAFATLRQPPTSPQLRATVARWSALRARAGDKATARRLSAFCRRQGG